MHMILAKTKKRWQVEGSSICLVLICIIATSLRFYELSFRSMWLDEGWIVAYSKLPMSDYVTFKIAGGINLFPLILKITGKIAGYTEISMRFIPALAGSLLVWSSYLLSRHFLSKIPSLIVAALVTFSPIAIVYSQEVANYTISMLIVTLLLHFFLKYIELEQPKYLLAFFAVGVIAVYLHLYNILILIGIVFYTMMKGHFSASAKRIYWITLSIFVCSMPVVYSRYSIFLALKGHLSQGALTFSFDKLFNFVKGCIFSWLHGPTNSIYVPQSTFAFIGHHEKLVEWFFIVLFVWVVLFNLLKLKRNLKFSLLLVCIASYSVIVIYLAFRSNQFFERYFLVLMPLFYILLSRAFCHPWKHWFFRVISGFVLVVLLLHFTTIYWQNHDKLLWKHDWRGICNNLRASATEQRPKHNYVILVPINCETPLIEFYLPDLRDKVLWDSEYQSYLYNPKYIFLSSNEIKGYNVKMLERAKESQINVLYVATLRGLGCMNYINKVIKDQFRLDKTEGTYPKLFIYRRHAASVPPNS